MRERDVSRLLAEREGGECEVRTPAGNIDVLTAKYVYEVKVARQWKAALGQVLAYSRAYPDRKPRLYLYGETGGMTRSAIAEHCRAAGVGVVWHRDEDVPPPAKKAAPAVADGMGLQLTAVDATYGIRCTCAFRLPTPTAPISQERLDAYADEALAVFDQLLDNTLTLKARAAFGGEQIVTERTRDTVRGHPVCYRLNLSIQPENFWKTFRVSLPGIKLVLPSGYRMGTGGDYWRSTIPELQRLYSFILHPEFAWTDLYGNRASRIERAAYLSLGIKKTRDGYRIGGR